MHFLKFFSSELLDIKSSIQGTNACFCYFLLYITDRLKLTSHYIISFRF